MSLVKQGHFGLSETSIKTNILTLTDAVNCEQWEKQHWGYCLKVNKLAHGNN